MTEDPPPSPKKPQQPTTNKQTNKKKGSQNHLRSYTNYFQKGNAGIPFHKLYNVHD